MNIDIFLILSAFLSIPVNSDIIKNARDLVDEAQKQIDDLKNIVEGDILAAHNDLASIELNFHVNSVNILEEGSIFIQQHKQTLDNSVKTMTNLAISAGKNPAYCTNNRLDILEKLPNDFVGDMRSCISDKDLEQSQMVADAKYIVDVSINKVHTLEFQIRQCSGDLLCISPLLTEIQLEKIRLPENINTEVQAIETLVESLKLLVQMCQDSTVSAYTGAAVKVVQDIAVCINTQI